jgi:hypothetical protein
LSSIKKSGLDLVLNHAIRSGQKFVFDLLHMSFVPRVQWLSLGLIFLLLLFSVFPPLRAKFLGQICWSGFLFLVFQHAALLVSISFSLLVLSASISVSVQSPSPDQTVVLVFILLFQDLDGRLAV